MEGLIQGEDREMIESSLNRLFEQSTIKQRLLNIFPGYYGRFISIHFGQFLNIELEREEQKEAYQIIVTFLDEMESFVIPTDLQNIIDTVTSTIDDVDVYKISSGWIDAVNDFDAYYNENQEMLE